MNSDRPHKRERLEDSYSFVQNQRTSLEDAFFHQEDKRILEKLQKTREIETTKKSLAQISGIQSEDVLHKLAELKIRPETLSALAIVPLIEVAWADGTLDEDEKKLIVQAAENLGKEMRPIDPAVLENFFSKPPAPSLFEAWKHYIEGLRDVMSSEEFQHLRKELLENTCAVALSSGGFFGFGNKVSPEEAEIIQKLERVFDKHS